MDRVKAKNRPRDKGDQLLDHNLWRMAWHLFSLTAMTAWYLHQDWYCLRWDYNFHQSRRASRQSPPRRPDMRMCWCRYHLDTAHKRRNWAKWYSSLHHRQSRKGLVHTQQSGRAFKSMGGFITASWDDVDSIKRAKERQTRFQIYMYEREVYLFLANRIAIYPPFLAKREL